MRAKTILALLFVASLGVAAVVVLRALPQIMAAAPGPAAREEILVATVPLSAGTLLRAQDVTWQQIALAPEAGEIVRPSEAARDAKPELDEQVRAEVYGAALRGAVVPGDPIRHGPINAGDPILRGGIVKPGDRDFLQVVLSPGRGRSRSPSRPAAPAPACCFPGTASTSC